MLSINFPKIKIGDFYETIDKVIKEGRHVSYLKKVIKDFEEYQRVFLESFSDKNPPEAIYVFRVNYIDKHPVWREVAILGSQTFCDLALEIIHSMEWGNDHMHGFSMKKIDGKTQNRYSEFSMYAPGWEDDPFPTYKTDKIKITDIDYTKHPKWNFVFDFGEGHEFDVELKKIDLKLKEKDFDRELPACIDQRGVAPNQYPDDYDG
jgi:hypothetical protein